MARTQQGNIDFELPPGKTGGFKDIEFFREDDGAVTLVFTPMGCHSDHCQIRWTLSREDFSRMGKVLFDIPEPSKEVRH